MISDFKNLLGAMPAIVFWKNRQSIYQGANDVFLQSIGLSAATLIGLSDFDLERCQHCLPQTAQKRRECDSQVMDKKIPLTFEDNLLLPDNTVRIFLVTESPVLDEKNEVVGVLGVAQDITAYKNQQRSLEIAKQNAEAHGDLSIELSAIIRYAHGLIYWKDINSVHLGCNDRFALLAGLPSAEAVVGKTDYDLVWREQAASFQRDDAEVMKSGVPKLQIEDRLPTAQGTVETVISNKVALRNRYGNIVGVLGVAIEITQLKNIQEELRIALAQVEATHQAKTRQALIDSAVQVSHDIRSPLAALNTVLRYLPTLPEDQRIAIRHAVNRINDIANNLLIEYRGEKKTGLDSSAVQDVGGASVVQPELLSDMADTLLSEKKIQIGDRRVELCLEIAESAFGIFVQVDATQMKRMLSNIMTNALEAMNDVGKITMRIHIPLGEDENKVAIDIVDTGKGIPAEVLTRIQQEGGTYGKVGGTGIGVAGAMALMREYGGSFSLTSQEGVGTRVSMRLPIVPTPSWFQSSLNLQPGMTVVVLDDDESIHAIWTTRCHAFLSHIQLDHVYGSDAFREYVASRDDEDDKVLYLMDYELLGSAETGLDLIESLGVAERAVLVTSRYEELAVRDRALRLGVKIIPKNFSPYIPIVLFQGFSPEATTASPMPELVFLDDDETLTDAWKRAARFEDRFILTFNSTRELRNALGTLQKNTPIYIDSNLHESISGHMFAKELYELGFTELYLASGYPAGYFGALPWIKGFVGKEPPF